MLELETPASPLTVDDAVIRPVAAAGDHVPAAEVEVPVELAGAGAVADEDGVDSERTTRPSNCTAAVPPAEE